MPIPQLTTNLNIIATLDPLPNDVTGLSAAEFQAKFDEAANIIKNYLNGLSIYSASEVDTIVANIIINQILDGTITDDKLSNSPGMVKQQLADIIFSVNSLAGVGRSTETVKKNADDILLKMPISISAVGIGQFKEIQSTVGASLALPSGGTWEWSGRWVLNSTGVIYYIGTNNAGIAAGGTTILSAQTGYIAVAIIRRIA